MKTLISKYDKFEERILVLSLAINVIIVFFQIIMRSFFNTSIAWSEELSRYIFIWQIWIGTSIAYKENQHIRVELIFSVFKSDSAKKVIDIIVNIIWLAFNLLLVYEGAKLLMSMNARHALSSGMRLPLVYIYSVLPISSLIVSIRIILNIFGIVEPETKEEIV